MSKRSGACVLWLALLAGCTSDGALYVELRTDFVPGEEIVSARTLVFASGETPIEALSAPLASGSTLESGFRIAEIDTLAAGSYRVRVELSAPDGSIAAQLTIGVDHRGPQTMTFLLTRDCRSVSCPGVGDDPSYTACSGGRCVAPECAEASTASECTPECTVHADCVAAAACADAQCTSGVCTSFGDHSRCAPTEYCNPDVGCRARSTTFCPDQGVTREQLAIFLVRHIHGTSFVPPAATGVFDDVPATSLYAPFIEQLATDEITAGCGGTSFCPAEITMRQQAAVWFVKAMYSPTFAPPAATGVFTDVMTTSMYAPFIEQLARDGFSNGCAPALFCPLDPFTRAQAAIYLVRMNHGAAYVPPPPTGLFTDVPITLPEAAFIEQFVRDGFSVGCGM